LLGGYAVAVFSGGRMPKKARKKVYTDPETGRRRVVRYGAVGADVKPGTKKGDAYCARSAAQMKEFPSAAKNPNSPLRLSRKRWRCSGEKSRR
jgi:hypothetical protein